MKKRHLKKHRYVVFISYVTVFNNPETVRQTVEYEKPITSEDIDELEKQLKENKLDARYNQNQYPQISGITKLEEVPS